MGGLAGPPAGAGVGGRPEARAAASPEWGGGLAGVGMAASPEWEWRPPEQFDGLFAYARGLSRCWSSGCCPQFEMAFQN